MCVFNKNETCIKNYSYIYWNVKNCDLLIIKSFQGIVNDDRFECTWFLQTIPRNLHIYLIFCFLAQCCTSKPVMSAKWKRFMSYHNLGSGGLVNHPKYVTLQVPLRWYVSWDNLRESVVPQSKKKFSPSIRMKEPCMSNQKREGCQMSGNSTWMCVCVCARNYTEYRERMTDPASSSPIRKKCLKL